MTWLGTSHDLFYIHPLFLYLKQNSNTFTIETAQGTLWLLNTSSIDFAYKVLEVYDL